MSCFRNNGFPKNMKISAYVLAVLVLLSSGCAVKPKSPADLSLQDKKAIADYAFLVMDSYREGRKIPGPPAGKRRNLNIDYDHLFISLYRNNTILGCQAGLAARDSRNRLFEDIKEATIRSIEDKRVDMPADQKIGKDTCIVVSLLYHKEKLGQNDPEFLKNNLELGIHSISIHTGGGKAFFVSSVPVTYNLTLEKTLGYLCKKVNSQKECFLNPDTQIYRYDTEVFKADAQGNITALYRCNILLDAKEITQKKIFESLSLLKDWFLNNVNPDTGLLQYTYLPSADAYSKNNNHARQLATLWALTELKMFLNTDSLDGIIKRTFDYYLSHLRRVGGYSYVAVDPDPSIALNGFLIMSVLNTESPDKEMILKRLGAGILDSQLPDGSFRTNFVSKEIKGVDYYPGEAMLSLMKLYMATRNPEYLDCVKKAFYYYSDYWRKNKNTAFIPWHTQADYLLYQETKDAKIAEFIFEMNDWLIDNYQIFDCPYIDKIGAFPKKKPSACSTAVYLEGMNNAYSLAKERGDEFHAEKYARSITLGARFVLQNQFNQDNTFYLKNPKRAIGGIRMMLVDNRQRVDFIQHTVMAFLKTYRNKIFE